jgi:RNA polymerase sigma-70 factor, ECF subfamily
MRRAAGHRCPDVWPYAITDLLPECAPSSAESTSTLISAAYHELRQIATRLFQHERPGHTLEPTALVHEALLRLMNSEPMQWKNYAHFTGIAAHVMRQVLVDYARAGKADKRGGTYKQVELVEELISSFDHTDESLALEDALTRLRAFAPRQARIVELRFFGGRSLREVARALGVGVTTVKTEWMFARAWLRGQLEPY